MSGFVNPFNKKELTAGEKEVKELEKAVKNLRAEIKALTGKKVRTSADNENLARLQAELPKKLALLDAKKAAVDREAKAAEAKRLFEKTHGHLTAAQQKAQQQEQELEAKRNEAEARRAEADFEANALRKDYALIEASQNSEPAQNELLYADRSYQLLGSDLEVILAKIKELQKQAEDWPNVALERAKRRELAASNLRGLLDDTEGLESFILRQGGNGARVLDVLNNVLQGPPVPDKPSSTRQSKISSTESSGMGGAKPPPPPEPKAAPAPSQPDVAKRPMPEPEGGLTAMPGDRRPPPPPLKKQAPQAVDTPQQGDTAPTTQRVAPPRQAAAATDGAPATGGRTKLPPPRPQATTGTGPVTFRERSGSSERKSSESPEPIAPKPKQPPELPARRPAAGDKKKSTPPKPRPRSGSNDSNSSNLL